MLDRSHDLELTLNDGALHVLNDNRARQGMPDLDYLGEVGPSLRWVAWRDREKRSRVTLEVPVRAVFSTDFLRIRYRGYVFAPEIAFERSGLLFPAARARIGAGPVFASGGLMDYWYRVEDRYARPGRPAYDAGGGYLGLRLNFPIVSRSPQRLSVTTGGRLEDFLGRRQWADSPLFRSEFNATLVAGLSYSLYRSTATVASASEPFDLTGAPGCRLPCHGGQGSDIECRALQSHDGMASSPRFTQFNVRRHDEVNERAILSGAATPGARGRAPHRRRAVA